jgi:isopentenyl diphosphate isomerase/L-lactate dehydrogenase-like FMN-dependent dehydrogenase
MRPPAAARVRSSVADLTAKVIAELGLTMALCGVNPIAEIGPELLREGR